MCGLIGCAGPMTIKHERAIKTLLILDSLRGIDSTGIAVVSRGRDLKMAKAIGDPFRLFDTKAFDKAVGGVNSVMIGHNRFATQGKVNVANSHPFAFPTLVGAHNGTLKNKYILDDAKLFDVDSENLFHHMDKNGVEDTIHKLDGAWALTWYNTKENTINFLRNEERPLHITVTKDNVLFWASESWMLRIALSREGLEFEDTDILKEDTWHKIKVAANGDLSKPHLTPLASKFVPYVSPSSSAWDNITPHNRQLARVDSYNKNSQSIVQKTVAQQHGIVLLNPYKKDETITVEVVGEGVDKQGARFYMCKDRKHPEENIRLYKSRNDTVELLNKFITCKLHSFRFNDFFGEHHKVEHGSVALLKEEVAANDTNDKKQSAGTCYHDAQKKLIPYKDWMAKHGTCDMCQGAVNPEMDNRFTVSGDIICHECVKDPVTQQYCNFQ